MCCVLLLVQSPGACFIKAAKAGVVDDLKGNLDALAWGKVALTGTGGHFDILYSGKVDNVLFFFLFLLCFTRMLDKDFPVGYIS